MRTRPSFTLGIEEEFQTVDPVTRDLRSHVHTEIISKGKTQLRERIRPEMHQSVVEVGTGICKNIKEAKAEVFELRHNMIKLAEEHDLRLAAAGTHPFADWTTQGIFPDERYHTIVEDTCVNAYDIYLTSHKGANDRVIGTVLKSIWDNIDKLPPLHPSFKDWTRQRAVDADVTMPYHPAAVQFFKERGTWPASMDDAQRKLLAMNP